MSSPTLIQIVDTARNVAREVIMPHFLTAQRNTKDDGSLFTVVDLAAQEALIERLPRIIDRPVLGEEMPESLQLRLWHEGQDGIWCIDPIDGTTNFVNGIPFFGVAIAYIAEGRTRYGVVYNPMTDEAFYAEEGGGAFLNGTALPLRTPARHLLDAVAGVDFKRIPKPLADALATQSPFYSQRNFGSSALEWCFVAAARLDVYLHGGQMMWDFAAGTLIAAEAGAQCSMLDGEPLDMSPGRRLRSSSAPTRRCIGNGWTGSTRTARAELHRQIRPHAGCADVTCALTRPPPFASRKSRSACAAGSRFLRSR